MIPSNAQFFSDELRITNFEIQSQTDKLPALLPLQATRKQHMHKPAVILQKLPL
nr:hypothetical protein [Mucilaginibacter sp. FT3.2]